MKSSAGLQPDLPVPGRATAHTWLWKPLRKDRESFNNIPTRASPSSQLLLFYFCSFPIWTWRRWLTAVLNPHFLDKHPFKKSPKSIWSNFDGPWKTYCNLLRSFQSSRWCLRWCSLCPWLLLSSGTPEDFICTRIILDILVQWCACQVNAVGMILRHAVMFKMIFLSSAERCAIEKDRNGLTWTCSFLLE